MKNQLFIRFTAFLIMLVPMLFGCLEDPFDAPGLNAPEEDFKVDVRHEVMQVTTTDARLTISDCDLITWPDGEIYFICVPSNWNGELILYAHGYVSKFEPLQVPEEAEDLAPLVSSLGYAFATTSFSRNGLSVKYGIEEIKELRQYFVDHYGTPDYVYMTGGSQGGLITTLSLENNPHLFNGGFSLCGPCGDFERQLNHYGSFRVLYDYFFKDIAPLPGSVDNIPQELIDNWDSYYVPYITHAIIQHPVLTEKLLKVGKAPVDPDDPSSIIETVIRTLWYNVFAIDDARVKIRGTIFDNRDKYYFGTGSWLEDLRLNRKVQRIQITSYTGETPLSFFETTGRISDPLVMMHTTLDPVQLFWHQPFYRLKAFTTGNGLLFSAIPIVRYGHCAFTDEELINGLSLLIFKVKGFELLAASQLLSTSNDNGELVLAVEKEIVN